MEPFFSVIIVCFQAGGELEKTVESVLSQTEANFEIIVKDGGSTDGAPGRLPEDPRIRLFCGKDEGIYDAMNQAADRVKGRYVLFLNCGDYLYDNGVLAAVRRAAESERGREPGNEDTGSVKAECQRRPIIFYGNTYERKSASLVMSNPKLDAFGCYRNIPCHQSCFYDAELIRTKLLKKRGREQTYELKYRVRADYEHFLWCFFTVRAHAVYLPLTVCSYEGGGFSESAANRAAAKKEHRVITGLYMTRKQRFCYRVMLLATLAPLRTRLAKSRRFSGIYQGVKRLIYRRRAS